MGLINYNITNKINVKPFSGVIVLYKINQSLIHITDHDGTTLAYLLI